MHAYRSQAYWEAACASHDVWDGNFTSGRPGKLPLFLHVQFLSDNDFYNHWACYDDSEKLLGFIKHIYIPTAAYSFSHPDKPVATPFGDPDAFMASLPVPVAANTAALMSDADALWDLSESRRVAQIVRLCRDLTRQFKGAPPDTFGVTIACYPGTRAIDAIIRQYYWDEAVFVEDVGMTFAQWETTCRDFHAQQKNSRFFLSLLKNRLLAVA